MAGFANRLSPGQNRSLRSGRPDWASVRVDEDYEGFGLSGELSAVVLEAGIPCKYARISTQTTIPYAQAAGVDAAMPLRGKRRLPACYYPGKVFTAPLAATQR